VLFCCLSGKETTLVSTHVFLTHDTHFKQIVAKCLHRWTINTTLLKGHHNISVRRIVFDNNPLARRKCVSKFVLRQCNFKSIFCRCVWFCFMLQKNLELLRIHSISFVDFTPGITLKKNHYIFQIFWMKRACFQVWSVVKFRLALLLRISFFTSESFVTGFTPLSCFFVFFIILSRTVFPA